MSARDRAREILWDLGGLRDDVHHGKGYQCFAVPVGDDDSWVAIIYVSLQGHDLVVSEVRIVARRAVYMVGDDGEESLSPSLLASLSVWSGDAEGIDADVPAGGITAMLLRKLHVGRALGEFRARLRAKRHDPITVEIMERQRIAGLVDAGVHLGRQARGRKPLGPRDLIPAAAAYADAYKRNKRSPIKEAARALDWSEARVRDYVSRSRRPCHFEGKTHPPLLDEADFRGAAGGDLTPYGRKLWRQVQGEERAKAQKGRRRR